MLFNAGEQTKGVGNPVLASLLVELFMDTHKLEWKVMDMCCAHLRIILILCLGVSGPLCE